MRKKMTQWWMPMVMSMMTERSCRVRCFSSLLRFSIQNKGLFLY